MHNVGIFLFDEIEVLDFAGPFEVFSTATRVAGRQNPGTPAPFSTFTVGQRREPLRTRGGLQVSPTYAFGEHPGIDLLLIPGGVVSAELDKPAVIAWIAEQAAGAAITASVCTGAFLLGKAGLLRGRRVTTHWEDIADLRAQERQTIVVDDQRWVEENDLITSAGISAGLDMSLHLVARLTGHELARKTARQMDYAWQETPTP